jgi:hypothetical protein
VQLDRTLIAIHERSLLETLDLSLHVVRRYLWPLAVTFSMGAVPLAVVNHFLVGWMLDVEMREEYFYVEELPSIMRYFWGMTGLVFLSAPLASVFATKFLGDAVFVERPGLWSVWTAVWKLAPRVAWCQLLVRGILAGWLLYFSLERQVDFQVGRELLLMMILLAYAGAVRAWRPFINEVVLLECNPLVARSDTVITVSKRSSHLHAPSSGDLMSRWVSSAAIACFLTGTVFGAFLFCSGVFLNDWRPGPWMLLTIYPLSLWIVAGFMTVVRFLSYLDVRIRHEGWETELLLRAEAARIAGRVA